MKTVHDLTQNELEELRSRYYHQHLDDGSLFEVIGKEIENEYGIPMDVVEAYYEATFFVDEDFWCNEKDQETMKTFLTKSLSPMLTDEELEFEGCYATSFISFERAIKESEELNGLNREIKGYKITEQGIVLILDQEVMKTLHFRVEVRDKDGSLYKDMNGNNITSVCDVEGSNFGEELTQFTCENMVEKFESFCKEGSKINIEVRYFDSITETYPSLYSYYGAEKRFVKH